MVVAAGFRTVMQRFDARHHRRVPGLFDLNLEPHADEGVMVPSEPDVALSARDLADLVRRSAEPADDVRVLMHDGAAHRALFTEVAGRLSRDVLVTPDGAEVRHRRRGDGDELLDAVAVDRVTRQPVDWVLLQPPDLATALPGWNDLEHGMVRPRHGTVALPLPDGVALATRADFVTRRAAAYRLRSGSLGLATVAVTVRGGDFLVGDYAGRQDVRTGHEIAAILADLPLYGCDVRLWLTWPSDPAEQARLAANAAQLATAVGAVVWTPPTGGAVELLDNELDLRAVDRTGMPAAWRGFPPAEHPADPGFRSSPTGRLVPVAVAEAARVHTAPRPESPPAHPTRGRHPHDRRTRDENALPGAAPLADAPAGEPPEDRARDAAAHVMGARESEPHDGRTRGGPAPGAPPWTQQAPQRSSTVTVHATPHPPVVAEPRRLAGHGVPWLGSGQFVNAEPFDLFVSSVRDPEQVLSLGVPSSELFLVGRLDPRPLGGARPATNLLRIHVEPGGAIPIASIRSHVPASFQHLLGSNAFLLPAGRLDHARLLAAYRCSESGRLSADREFEPAPVRLDCTNARHGVAGLPNDVPPWPPRPASAYALVPQGGRALPKGWLRLFRRAPEPVERHALLKVRVPKHRAIDVSATAAALAALPTVRSRAEQLDGAGIELIVPARGYERLTVESVADATGGSWRPRRGGAEVALSMAAVRARTASAAG
jgi:hypothetical protein